MKVKNINRDCSVDPLAQHIPMKHSDEGRTVGQKLYYYISNELAGVNRRTPGRQPFKKELVPLNIIQDKYLFYMIVLGIESVCVCVRVRQKERIEN